MKRTLTWLMALIVGLAISIGGGTKAARAGEVSPVALPFVVDVKWLAANLASPDLVVLHVGNPLLYAKRHIRGARLVSFADVALEGKPGESLVLELPPADVLRERLEKLGISDRSRVVVTFGEDWTSAATRLLFTLHAAGLGARSTMLDGGLPAWTRAGYATTEAVSVGAPGKLSPLQMQPAVVQASRVLTSLGKKDVKIVDARDREFYDGAKVGGMHGPAHKKGHIKGAVSLPYHSLFDEQHLLRSPEELRALFAQAGVGPGDAVIAYCHIGQQATAVWLAAKLLGHQVLLYDGAFEDWSLFHPAYPVEASPTTPAAKSTTPAAKPTTPAAKPSTEKPSSARAPAPSSSALSARAPSSSEQKL